MKKQAKPTNSSPTGRVAKKAAIAAPRKNAVSRSEPKRPLKPTLKKIAPSIKKGGASKSPLRSVRQAKPAVQTKARALRKPAGGSERVRRMILIDVENTSSEERLSNVLEHLKIDRRAMLTEMVAVGNWKAVGSRTARLLARSGAQLMHSAPATGVRDWSDLWIAVAAGRWLALANPGDRLDIVSDDHAFDAVADGAGATGVDFHRISYRTLHQEAEEPARSVVPAREALAPRDPAAPRRRRRGGRGRNRPTMDGLASELSVTPAAPASSPARPPVLRGPVTPAVHVDGGHGATLENIREAIARLTSGNPERWVNLDLVGSELRTQGFTRPPGSPRLVTRVRLVHDIELSPAGMVRLKPTAVAPTAVVAEAAAPAVEASKPRAPRPRRAPAKATLAKAPVAKPSVAKGRAAKA